MRNHTSLSTFILLGLTGDPQMQLLIFLFLFVSYTLSITGNMTIIILTLVDSRLKTAMYIFLKHFSFLETFFTTVCIPRFLYSLSTGDKTISHNACEAQLFFVFLFGATEFFSWPPCPMTTTWPSANPCDHHEQQSLWDSHQLLLDGWSLCFNPTT